MTSIQEWVELLVDLLGLLWNEESKHISDADFLDLMIKGKEIDCDESDRVFAMMNQDLEGKSAKLINAKTHLERVAIINEVFRKEEFGKILNGLKTRFAKDEGISKLLEEKGQEFDIRTHEAQCLKCYNLATMFLKSYDPNLPRLYAIRSKLFYKLKQGADALEDAHLALTSKPPCPKDMEEGLKSMAKVCRSWVKKEWNEMWKLEETTPISKWKTRRDSGIFKIQEKTNKDVPCAVQGIRVSDNKEQGKHLFTDRKIDPGNFELIKLITRISNYQRIDLAGTAVLVEKPFCKILNKTTTWDTTHCAHCFAEIERVIPCYSSTVVAYCSEDCRLRDCDQGIHFLHPCLPFLHIIQMPITKMLGLKLICKAGPTKLYKCWEMENGKEPASGDSGMKYEPNDYDQILSMKSKVNPETISANSWYAVASINALDHLTNFFDGFENQPKFKDYVASIFIRHAVSLPYSALALTENVNDDTISIGERDYENAAEVGLAIYPFISMITHSLEDANVFRQNLPNGLMAIITNRVVYPGEELKFTSANGAELLKNDVVIRNTIFAEDYNYPIPYVPCTLKWPMFGGLVTPEREFLCPNCSGDYACCSAMQARLCKLPPADENGLTICATCFAVTSVHELIAKADEIRLIMGEVEDLLVPLPTQPKKPIKAIRLTQQCITDYQSLLCSPSCEIQWAQVLLAQAFDFITKI